MQDGFLIYYRKMTAVTTKLVTNVNSPTSLIILMTCAGESYLKLVKLVHKLHYLIFSLQNLHGNAEIIEKFTSKNRLQYTV